MHIPVTATAATWRYSPRKDSNEQGAQIDLLFDRDDSVITLCEIKYSDGLFEINKQYLNNLKNKIDSYKKQTHTSKQIFMTMISSVGIKVNKHSEEIISGEATLIDLFSD